MSYGDSPFGTNSFQDTSNKPDKIPLKECTIYAPLILENIPYDITSIRLSWYHFTLLNT